MGSLVRGSEHQLPCRPRGGQFFLECPAFGFLGPFAYFSPEDEEGEHAVLVTSSGVVLITSTDWPPHLEVRR